MGRCGTITMVDITPWGLFQNGGKQDNDGADRDCHKEEPLFNQAPYQKNIQKEK